VELDAVIATLHEGLLVVDRGGTVITANAAAAELWGAGDLVGVRWADLAHEVYEPGGGPEPVARTPVLRAMRGETVEAALVQVVRPDGSVVWTEVNARPIDDGAVLSTYIDVTDRVRRERRVRHEVDADPLTGVANRRALERTLEAAVERARRESREVAVLQLDLDGFRTLNDRWGHLAGDRALRAVARRLQRCVRERDLVARNGGDEFALVLPDLQPAAPIARECRMRVEEALSAPVRFEGGSTTLEVSIGIATFPHNGADGLALLAHADRQLGR
jgi:diguanylate cyclase (GGDEF)-like protein/PAS domain S-box-containing protein